MEEFMGIRFTGNLSENYRSSVIRKNPTENGHEYELYLRFINILVEGIKGFGAMPYMYGNISPRFIERRFFGKQPCLITEHKDVGSFPDFTLVNDDIVVIFDHFKVDASKPFGKSRKPSGTKYMQFRGVGIPDAARTDSDALEAALRDEEIELSVDALISNVAKKFQEKTAKVEMYKTRVREYIATGYDENIVADDLSKPFEAWLMIEDLSPTCGFAYIGQTLAALLEECPSINGLLYISNPYPDEMFSSPAQVALIVNDENARAELKRLGG